MAAVGQRRTRYFVSARARPPWGLDSPPNLPIDRPAGNGPRRAPMYDSYMPTEEISLKRLQHNCSVMLDRYVEVARATCEMVCSLQKLPVSRDRRLAIYLQRKREEEALAAHDKAALALLTALEIHPELLPLSAKVPQGISSSNSRGARLNTHRRGRGKVNSPSRAGTSDNTAF
jgi:hypothetical protein